MSTAAVVVGGGPAGLMAAETLTAAGLGVDLYDAMPTVGRKLLRAGRGGLNLTHAEPVPAFVRHYGANADLFRRLFERFSPADLRAWAKGLGIDTFVGTSGRVLPRGLASAPLLRRWVERLRARGVRFHPRHRWVGFAAAGGLVFARPAAARIEVRPDATVLALGGASYPHLGSDGAWAGILRGRGIEVKPFRPSNCGFEVGWSEGFRARSEGAPLKNLLLAFGDRTVGGEVVLTRHGVEGGGVYALSGPLRDALERHGTAVLHLDLKRDLTVDAVRARLERPRGKASLATVLRKALRLRPPVPALLREVVSPAERSDPARLAARIKRLPIRLTGVRPLAEALSTAGGIAFEELDAHLMLEKLPGVFAAGEMLDYDAPTGGYLLQAAFSTGVAAAEGAAAWRGRG